ncbi:interferon-induced very large GTPase 1-like [Ctenopharyngodon idella]|uniref:interferon-induced very large GTPase 1-like n=1 Tax=Ctenopharyngodon idella TaxID=7959 RepID=UPI00222F2FAD|nr:interferon-induced very large GTPase 1-like [Ctenopharyngodon idella]XP_051766897.1 interferon-induced very large GTPase 1-like [Ctenopharyngodon idella]
MDHNLTIVLFGNSAAVQLQHDNILLGELQADIENVEISRTVPLQMKISGRCVSVINMIGLHETAIDLDLLTGQLVNEKEIISFIFVVRLGQLTDADKMGIEWLQRVFGDRVLPFVIILFTYENEEESDSIIDDLKKNYALEQLLQKCGRRYHTCSKTMNNQSEMRDLMNRIEHLFTENNQQCYTSEIYKTALREREDVQDRTCQSDQNAIIEKSMDYTSSTETRERLGGEMQSIDGARSDRKGNRRGDKAEHLFHRLYLDKRHPFKLRAEDVLQLTKHSLESHESCAEEDLIQTFLQKLLMMNYRARYIKTIDTQHDGQQINNDLFEDDGDPDIFREISLFPEETNRRVAIHPMDVQMALFHCADSFLKQLMVTKLSQCQYALPLLVPDPFTQEIEFPLWTFRQINKSWKMKNTNNEIISKIQPVWKAETPMVSFFRFGSLTSSKSQLINNLINEKHNTFFHMNCPGSSKTRVLMDGVVEIAWYCPSGKDTDKFTQCVAFCNLHGDAGANEKQLQVLTEMSSVNVVILPRLDKNDKNAIKIQNLYRSRKPLICLFTEDEYSATEMRTGKYKIGLNNRNQSDVSEELIEAINKCLSSSSSESSSIFRLENVSRYSDIRVDEEHDNDCRKGKKAAQQLMALLEEKELTKIKETFLPCQGELWHQWCEKNKELHRSQGNEIDMELNQKQDMKIIRAQQHVLDIGSFMKLFITEMNSQSSNEKIFFLKWLAILLDEYTSADLSALHYKYDEKWSKCRAEQHMTNELAELDRISKELQAATFGLEHILREIGQIYESCKSVNSNKEGLPCNFSSLPSLAADMMLSGFPLELMDGDAAHVPVVWVTAVLHELIKKVGDQRVFVLSVLGIQSSGKSTMLNAMFGLQFAVSAGRCTRGAFMQLVRVSEEMKEQLKFDYILVVDTEGLRALELSGRSTRHQDNEMATFVVGLGNLTLINIFGESPSELQDILQIVVQAFMRMKKVRLNPSCMFVHQNVSEVTAGEKNMEGRRRLQETLDKMTKLAAKDEVYVAECFNDVITFDIQKDVKYFAQLWEGSPPMAPPNPSYCENIQELKTMFFSHASKSDGLELTQLKSRIKDLWEALLNERFVFSFRNALEIAAYRKLETEYSKWSWSLRSAMLEIENKLHNNIENETINEVSESDLQGKLHVKSEEVEKSMSEFFDKDKDKDILIQWKASFYIKINELQENIVRETTRKLNEILQQRDMKKKIDAQRTRHENTLFEKSKELAIKLKDKANDETILKTEFDSFWKDCVKNITRETPQIKNINVLNDMKQHLSNYKSVPVNAWKKSRDIFSVRHYSDYVQLKKSNETTGNAFRSAKQKFEVQTQIKNLVDDIAQQVEKMIVSYNIAKMGYNKTYIQEFADHIKERIENYEQCSRDYVLTKEFYIDLVISICKKENQVIIDQHRKFREANDPVLYFEKKSKEYYSVFQKYCQGATSAAIFGEIICQKLKEPIQKSVYKDTARNLTDEIKTNCESLNGNRSKLEKHILKTLAEQEDFDKYLTYFNSPRDHLKSFIRDEVNRYITDNFRVSAQPKMKRNIELLQQKIMAAAHRATTWVNTTSRDVQKWLDHFTLQLSDVLIFSVKDLSGLSHDGVDDFDLLEDVIHEELSSVLSEMQNEFSTETFPVNLEHNDRPDEILIDHLCQCCWIQCPFCSATCTNSLENHTGDHTVPFHRVDGLTGCCYEETECLSADFCTTLVRTGKMFYTGQWIPCREYRNAGNVYAEWSITPDFSELPYWKWFVCRFQKDLEDYFEKTFHRWDDISYGWSQYSKEQAIESLDEYI